MNDSGTDSMGTYFFECVAHCTEHTISFIMLKNKDYYPDLYLNIYLDSVPWYKRIWYAIKYIFGYKCKYGHWNCWEMKREDAVRLIYMCHDYLTTVQHMDYRLRDHKRIFSCPSCHQQTMILTVPISVLNNDGTYRCMSCNTIFEKHDTNQQNDSE